MHFIGVLNKDGGTFRTMDMPAFATQAQELFAAEGHSLECRVVTGGELTEQLEAAATDPAGDVLLAGGGDGTVSAAAGICFRHQRPLAVLPAGTMNLFARSLHIPLDLEAALTAIAGGRLQPIDIATANGRPFVHQYSVGLHSRLIRIREGLPYSSRWGKVLASAQAIAAALARPPVFDVEIRTVNRVEQRRATAVSVSNNALGEGHLPYAETLDRGVLGVYVVRTMPPAEMARFVLSLFIGSWKKHPLVSEKEVQHLTLTFPNPKPSARAVIDGELIPLDARVELAIHARSLQVIVPAEAPSAPIPLPAIAVA